MKKLDLTQIEPDESETPAPLRFYDPEIQNAWNAVPPDMDRIQRANQKAAKLNAAYLSQLSGFSERLSKKHTLCFRIPDIHCLTPIS